MGIEVHPQHLKSRKGNGVAPPPLFNWSHLEPSRSLSSTHDEGFELCSQGIPLPFPQMSILCQDSVLNLLGEPQSQGVPALFGRYCEWTRKEWFRPAFRECDS